MWSTKCRACVLCTCTSMCVQQFCVRSLQGCEIAAVLLWGWQCVQLRRLDWARWRLQTTQERSEEHTSELQSLMRISYAVFCLNKQQNSIITCPTLSTTVA